MIANPFQIWPCICKFWWSLLWGEGIRWNTFHLKGRVINSPFENRLFHSFHHYCNQRSNCDHHNNSVDDVSCFAFNGSANFSGTYEQTLVRYTKEKAGIQKELTKHPEKISNLDSYVNFTIDFSKSLSEKWEKSELGMKQKLQTMMFPDGIPFNKKMDDYRTCRVNTFFAAIDFISSNLAESKSGISEKNIENSALVVSAGIEPASKV